MRAPSGKFVVRTGPVLHGSLQQQAKATGVSLNQICLSKLSGGAQSNVGEMSELQLFFGDQLLGVAIFGSWARGDQTASSDRDLLIVLDKAVPIDRQLYRTWDERLSSSFGAMDSPHFVHIPEAAGDCGSLWLEASLEGIVVWEKGRQLTGCLQHIRHRIAAGDYVRKISHGHPYWISRGLNNEK